MIEQNDVLSASTGILRHGGTEYDDTLVASALDPTIYRFADVVFTEANDSVSSSASALVNVKLQFVPEGNDSLSASSSQVFGNPTALLTVTEEGDTLAGLQADEDDGLFSGVITDIAANYFAAEGDDSLLGNVILGPLATVNLVATEGDDSLTSEIVNQYAANLDEFEAPDTTSSDVTLGFLPGPNGALFGTEEDDTLTASMDFKGNLEATEEDDVLNSGIQFGIITGRPVLTGGGLAGRRRRKRWILPDGTEIYASEEEVRKLLDELRAGRLKPKQVVAKLKQTPLDPFLEVWDEEPPKVEAKRKSTDDEDFLAMLDLF